MTNDFIEFIEENLPGIPEEKQEYFCYTHLNAVMRRYIDDSSGSMVDRTRYLGECVLYIMEKFNADDQSREVRAFEGEEEA